LLLLPVHAEWGPGLAAPQFLSHGAARLQRH
jgi:hypothetical protein